MFGYITINKSEMRFREYDIYHSYYCGLCKALKKKYGTDGQISISYDMTFLIMLLSGLYEPKTEYKPCKCAFHPLERFYSSTNEISEYVADMNVLLSIYKCDDDWKDDKKLFRHFYGQKLKKRTKKNGKSYHEKEMLIHDVMEQLSKFEKENSEDLDAISGLFGEIMGDVFVYKDDEWAQTLSDVGYNLGKFIYIMDAYEDIETDIKKGNFNPLKNRYRDENFDEDIQTVLMTVMSECCKSFETLPIVENVDIMRNILYSGVWDKFDEIKLRRSKQ